MRNRNLLTSSTDLAIFDAIVAKEGQPDSPFEAMIRRIAGFDWYYSYSDSGSVYRAGVEGEKLLKADVAGWNDPVERVQLEKYVTNHELIKQDFPWYGHESLTQWPGEHPLIYAALQGFTETEYHEILDIQQSALAMLKSLPANRASNAYGFFVYTPKTDIARMRAVSLSTGLAQYIGVSVPKEAQEEVSKFFSSFNRDSFVKALRSKLVRQLENHFTLVDSTTNGYMHSFLETRGDRQYRFII